MPKIRRMLQFAGLLFCVFFSALSAKAVLRPVHRMRLSSSIPWSTEEGLPQSSVISVIQTRDGYFWLGTLNGLVRL